MATRPSKSRRLEDANVEKKKRVAEGIGVRDEKDIYSGRDPIKRGAVWKGTNDNEQACGDVNGVRELAPDPTWSATAFSISYVDLVGIGNPLPTSFPRFLHKY